MFATLFSHAKVLAIAGVVGAGALFATQPASAANWRIGVSLAPVIYPAGLPVAQPVYVPAPVYAPAPVYQVPVIAAAPCFTLAPAPVAVYSSFPIFYGDRGHRVDEWHGREHFDREHFASGRGFDRR